MLWAFPGLSVSPIIAQTVSVRAYTLAAAIGLRWLLSMKSMSTFVGSRDALTESGLALIGVQARLELPDQRASPCYAARSVVSFEPKTSGPLGRKRSIYFLAVHNQAAQQVVRLSDIEANFVAPNCVDAGGARDMYEDHRHVP